MFQLGDLRVLTGEDKSSICTLQRKDKILKENNGRMKKKLAPNGQKLEKEESKINPHANNWENKKRTCLQRTGLIRLVLNTLSFKL